MSKKSHPIFFIVLIFCLQCKSEDTIKADLLKPAAPAITSNPVADLVANFFSTPSSISSSVNGTSVIATAIANVLQVAIKQITDVAYQVYQVVAPILPQIIPIITNLLNNSTTEAITTTTVTSDPIVSTPLTQPIRITEISGKISGIPQQAVNAAATGSTAASGSTASGSTTASSNTTASNTTTTRMPVIYCTSNGEKWANTQNCNEYFYCWYGTADVRKCPLGLSYNCFTEGCGLVHKPQCCERNNQPKFNIDFCFQNGKTWMDPYNAAGYYECVNHKHVKESCSSGQTYNRISGTCA